MLILAALALAQSAPQPGPMQTFGDWTVACDNGKRCEMTSLLPEADIGDEGEWQISVVREAGPIGLWSVELMGEIKPGIRLSVTGTDAASAAAVWRGTEFSGGQALAIVRAMVNGRIAQLHDARGTLIGRVSLTGSSASLRFIDAQQGRAGTVTAAVASGARPASAVPAAPAIPVVASIRPRGAAVLSAATLKQLWAESDCAENYDEDGLPSVERHALGGGATLALVPCGAGAYNYSSVPYVVRGGKAALAEFDLPPGWGGDGGPPMLVNANFDPKTGELGSYAKGRGIGDCGSSETYVWDGKRFRLVGARAMGECRGSTNWLTVWRARAVAR